MRNKTWSVVLAAVFVLAMMATGAAQKLQESALRRLDGSAATFPVAKLGAKLDLAMPRSLRSGPIFNNSANNSAPSGQSGVKGNPGGLPGIDSFPTLRGHSAARGRYGLSP